MADNYLERQRELYEARKAAWEKSRKPGFKKKKTSRPAGTTMTAGTAPAPDIRPTEHETPLP